MANSWEQRRSKNSVRSIFEELNDDHWHHVAIKREGTSVTYYVDGTSRGGFSSSLSTSSTAPLLIGFDTPAPAVTPFVGRLDEIAIYAGALAVEDIARLAGGESPPSVSVPVEVEVPTVSLQLANLVARWTVPLLLQRPRSLAEPRGQPTRALRRSPLRPHADWLRRRDRHVGRAGDGPFL